MATKKANISKKNYLQADGTVSPTPTLDTVGCRIVFHTATEEADKRFVDFRNDAFAVGVQGAAMAVGLGTMAAQTFGASSKEGGDDPANWAADRAETKLANLLDGIVSEMTQRFSMIVDAVMAAADKAGKTLDRRDVETQLREGKNGLSGEETQKALIEKEGPIQREYRKLEADAALAAAQRKAQQADAAATAAEGIDLEDF